MTISIVLYGRNDNYGYNLHKRAALSLNCMAEVLTDPSDEIVFVDYNTPDDFPTFPEAIQDTLTKRARNILRILRVRPRIHERFKSRTHLVAIEPVARNVAIRRSNPANRWILSTNTDMIFVPRGIGSLSKIVRDLAPGFYHAPRIEIPEVLWESFDRQAPGEIIRTIREWGSVLHLNEIILGSEYILYDGPGDFQLFLRDDLFAHHGFHEGMLLGWHVDSNIARRMYVKYGLVGDLGKQVYGYHCDHTRQVTPAHGHSRVQNDWRVFCDQVDTADVLEQAHTWGCPNDTIEEVRLVSNTASAYVRALRQSVGSPLQEPRRIKYTHETFNKIDYDPAHVLPFLADLFVPMPRAFNVAWFGVRWETLSKFASVWERLAFTGDILVDNELIEPREFIVPIKSGPTSQLLNAADVFVFDFGGLPGSPQESQRNKQIIRSLLHRFVQVVREERRRGPLGFGARRLVALNAINNRFEWLMRGYVAAAATPCGTYMRHGFVLPLESKEDWLPAVYIGRAGIRKQAHLISSEPRNLGAIIFGPYKYLDPGYYRLSIKIDLAASERETGGTRPCIAIEIRVGVEVLAVYLIRRAALKDPDHHFHFAVWQSAADMPDGIETRVTLFDHVALTISSLEIASVSSDLGHKLDIDVPLASPPLAFKIEDWLAYLSPGPLGRVDDAGAVARSGPAEFVFFGPYWPLPAGHYEVAFSFEIVGSQDAASPKPVIRVDVVSGESTLAAAVFNFDVVLASAPNSIRLPFEMDGHPSALRQIETRIWSSGEAGFQIRSVIVKALPPSIRRDLLPFLLIGHAGRRVGAEISNLDGRTGVIAYSPTISIKPGFWRMSFAVEITSDEGRLQSSQCCAIAQVNYGPKLLAIREITLEVSASEHQQFLFEIPVDSDPAVGLEFVLRGVDTASIILRSLSFEPTDALVEQSDSGPLSVRNWLPFLYRGSRARLEGSSIVVNGGPEGFSVYGPYWTLAAGHYEMRALIAPELQNRDEGTAVLAQVIAEGGERLFVQSLWRLNQYRLSSPSAVTEFRLPFTLHDDFSLAARTIETRFFTHSNAKFRTLSLAVVVRHQGSENDWFPYLTVEECGFHTGTEIKSLPGKVGYIACTPPMAIDPGHYRLSSIISGEATECDAVSFEIRCGSDVIATVTEGSESDQSLEFELPHEFSGRPIDVRIRVIEPTTLTVHGLAIKKLSDSIDPAWRERIGHTLPRNQQSDIHLNTGTVMGLASFSSSLKSIAARVVRRIKRAKL